MGKATKWFRSILGLKKPDPTHSPSQPNTKEKRRWSFVKSYREKDSSREATVKHSSLKLNERETRADDNPSSECEDANKHAIAVAAATAAVAEAAVAAAHAAAAVVRLTSNSGRCGDFPSAYVGGCGGTLDEPAAIKIQSAFRGYLVRILFYYYYFIFVKRKKLWSPWILMLKENSYGFRVGFCIRHGCLVDTCHLTAFYSSSSSTAKRRRRYN